MPTYEHVHDMVHWHVSDITSRIIAKSGIPTDRFHLGKIILQSLEDNGDSIHQIDAATGEEETNLSVLRRSKQCALAFRKLGVKQGDVIVLMGPNHLDLVIPMYAALYIGAIIAPVDKLLKVSELKDTFEIAEPKLVLCQSENVEDVQDSLDKTGLKAKIISFDKTNKAENFNDLIGQENDVDTFKAADFDPAETIAFIVPTSGTTGLPKFSAATHKNFVIMEPSIWSKSVQIPPYQSVLVASPLQWLSAIMNYMCSPILKMKRIQSSLPVIQEHAYEIINKYKPQFLVISPTMMTTLLKPGDREQCDFSCFELIYLGGSAVHSDLIYELKKITPNTTVLNVYGMSELTSMSFLHCFGSPLESCGKPLASLQYRLVNIETQQDITKPHEKGELWMKGPGFFKGYYKNPEVTKEVFTEDGWFKTGDLFYRDEQWNYYFVERIKLLLKYRNHQISTVELEKVILQHPAVLDVAVTGIQDPECGDLPVACVVTRPGHTVTAHEIKDLVKDSLTDAKQLRGGVVFMDQLPITSSTKIHRRKLKEMVMSMKRQ